MSTYINIEDFIRQAPVGLATYGRVFDGEKHQVDLFVREEKKFLCKIPPNPRVELRSGLFEQDGIALAAVLLEVADDNDLRYETWWNYHAEGGADLFWLEQSKARSILMTKAQKSLILCREENLFGSLLTRI